VKGLNQKQAAFVKEYIVDYNGTRAAERAGYSKKTAAVQASRLLKSEKVIEAIKEHQQELMKSQVLTEDKVLAKLGEVLDRCMSAVPVMEWDFDAHEYRETGEWQFDSKGSLRALEMLGKHIGMFTGDKEKDKEVHVFLGKEFDEWKA